MLLKPEVESFSGKAWRFVEGEQGDPTEKVAYGYGEAEVLEGVIGPLHSLLSDPFRYPGPASSRFRRVDPDSEALPPGVWYGSECIETAAAEVAFYTALFYSKSSARFSERHEYDVVLVEIATSMAFDLASESGDAEQWMRPNDYEPCWELAESLRSIDCELIRYVSVRDPEKRANLAVLSPRAFASGEPIESQTWHIRLGSFGVRFIREGSADKIEFPPDSFEADSRLDGMVWDRPTEK